MSRIRFISRNREIPWSGRLSDVGPGLNPGNLTVSGWHERCCGRAVHLSSLRPFVVHLRVACIVLACTGLLACSGGSDASSTASTDVELLHVSYDPTRELFAELNTRYAEIYRERTTAAGHPGTLTISMSHGGSGRQARAVIDGLEADVVSLALPWDIDALAREGSLLSPSWADRLPDHSTPWYSTIVFVVRRGNPRGIHDWGDLVRGETSIITPNPRTSGGARWAYLAAWGWAVRQPNGNEETATALLTELFRRVPVLDSGARGASATFARNGVGDVLLTWENEAHLLLAEHTADGLEIVVPSESILAEPPIAWVDSNVERHHTRDVAEAYLRWFYEEEAQEIAARHHLRPRNEAVLSRHRGELPDVRLFTIEETSTSWAAAQTRHFADGALFDRISEGRSE
jgi:sulfate/thiosulfate-binding protein